ncbi:MAG: helix-turn-helix domain-containing protein [Candidatus Omnitrophota bacterium]|nr:helix-turn-helix domain-containing protein [Candidatus Omnitrophota bacterium]MBU4467958.1 helix-turn-helix domain-containing protein [Candidatus Omnitrophota bacterium]MCG2708608.1 helix-turn-helix domain-containing protein [Candidatus Omnitrophota bacterium]MDP3042332.1 helix-turn-helix domain-containing protein [Candidatus Omnitrophota bacterium]
MKELSEAYTAEDVAQYLKLHPYTVRRLAREKKIPAFRVGGQWRFRKDEIDQWSRSYPFSDKPEGYGLASNSQSHKKGK